MSAYTKGQRVRFTASSLGCIATLDSPKFEPEIVNKDDTGKYLGPHPHPHLTDWHLITVNLGGRDLYVPCYETQFEAAES